MAVLSQSKIVTLMQRIPVGVSSIQLGRSLEDMLCYIFGKVPGVSITHRNQLNTFTSEEIDVALWNDKISGAFDFLPDIILIEAKNWSNRVGSEEVAWFDRKVRSRGLDFGVLVAMNGITGNSAELTSAHQIVATSLFEQRRLVILTGDDLSTLRSTENLVKLVKTKLCELIVTGTLIP